MTQPSATLLPASSTQTERKLAQVGADIEAVPVPLRSLRRADTVPEPLLPWLAWERSVDRWDDAWTEAAKRRALADAFFVHQHKGTVGALRRAVAPLGYLLEVKEWWQHTPAEQPGTFRLAIGVLDSGITEVMHAELERIINATKRLSQHLIGLAIAAEVRGTVKVCVAAYDGDELTVYPYEPEPIHVSAALNGGLHDHTIDTMTVYP